MALSCTRQVLHLLENDQVTPDSPPPCSPLLLSLFSTCQVLRLLENDQVTPEEVEEALKDPLEYYLQSSTEAGACNADMRTVVLVALVG